MPLKCSGSCHARTTVSSPLCNGARMWLYFIPTYNIVQPFKGGTWKECGAFIQSVRAAAWREGKLRDSAWMADFASLHLSEYALAWYFRLSPEAQQDWPQLQAAFVERWPFPDGDNLSECAPSPCISCSQRAHSVSDFCVFQPLQTL